jgi:hypothetical protein
VRRRRRTKVDERLVPVRREAVHTVDVDGEAVLLDEDSGRLHLLNGTGALVWACFDGESAIGEIVTDISEELGAPRDVVLADTLAISRHLASEGLLANVEPARRRGPSVEVGAEPPEDPRLLPEPPNP